MSEGRVGGKSCSELRVEVVAHGDRDVVSAVGCGGDSRGGHVI